MQSPTDPADRTGTIGVEAFDATYEGRLPGVGRLAARCRVRAGRGRRDVRGAPADRRGPLPAASPWSTAHAEHRGAADPHRAPAAGREHGPEQREAVNATNLDRAAVALERAEKAISDLDAEIRIARALLASGGVGGVD